ncbi:MAG: hypothetical protein UY61_C0036G0009 [Candidatus Adlerbacteria bacterium GW2011_GWC1_50_9]|uniref:Uncharacterized protein n=1 Tax=Candidatus Adlerbacteria bacterium GW2011_GWC1_50_9 TaxID=1618608 RepID=A0A0G1YZC5_9BACT|nr:MAG: hypothetical protein UY61_C0036G0009 [Candidatus Adlerbacteria bacterium GW2011_GWC1_50_9]
MDREFVIECGERLLVLFREEQKTHGNVGCVCEGCKKDIIKAFERLCKEKDL